MKRSKKSQKIILTIVVTLLVIAGLFILRSFFGSKFGILARTTQTEQILASKSVANGDFKDDKLTNAEIINAAIELQGDQTEGTIQGNFTLPQTSSITKITAGVSNFDTTCTKIGIEAEFSTDSTTWSQRYISNISTTLTLPSPVSAKYAIYKITLSSCNTTDTPQLYNLTLLGYGTVRADQAVTTAQCTSAGGTWKADFPNGCANSCSYIRNQSSTHCTAAITAGCLCPSQQCWDSSQGCVNISTSVPTPPEPNVCTGGGGTGGSCTRYCGHAEETCGQERGCGCPTNQCWSDNENKCVPLPPIPEISESVQPPVPGISEPAQPPIPEIPESVSPSASVSAIVSVSVSANPSVSIEPSPSRTTSATASARPSPSTVIITPTPTPAPTATTITSVFSTPSETFISGIQSGTSFYLIITAVVLIGGFIVYRIVISKEE